MADVVLSELVEQSLVLVRPLADQKALHLRVVELPPPVHLHTDAGKVRQILVNLLANAVKFSERGDVLIAVRTEGLDADLACSSKCRIPARGSPPSTTTGSSNPSGESDRPARDREGTGLGLSLARQLARFLGGDVVLIASALGRGSTFVVTLPTRIAA